MQGAGRCKRRKGRSSRDSQRRHRAKVRRCPASFGTAGKPISVSSLRGDHCVVLLTRFGLTGRRLRPGGSGSRVGREAPTESPRAGGGDRRQEHHRCRERRMQRPH